MNQVGLNNLLGFMGVVENIDKSSGRVQVRAFGFHPTYAEDPDFDLPWATPVNGTYGSMNFIPQRAEWVFGFFVDGRDAQQPIIIGTIPGANATMPFGSGDQAENHYVKPSTEAVEKFGTTPLHPVVSGEDISETPLALAEATKKVGIETSDGSSVTEPDTVMGGDASYVSVISPGHARSYVEVSGSDGAEHISLMHTSGAQVQIDNSGNIKIKSMGNLYSGSEGNAGEYVEGRKDLIVQGKYTIAVNGGDCILNVAGNLVFNAKNDVDFNVSGKMNFNVAESITMTGSKLNFHAREDNVDIYAAKKLKAYSSELLSIRTDGSLFVDTADANLNSSGDFKVSGSTASVTGSSKVALAGSNAYIDGGATFIDGDPNFNSGQASGKADGASVTSERATPMEQSDLDSRAVVTQSDQQDIISTSPTTGVGAASHDDIVDISINTAEITSPNAGTFNSEVFRNVAVGRASALLELIGDVEGNGDYNIVFLGSKIPLPKPLTQMTITEVIQWQTDSVRAGSESSAAGKYQVIKKTLLAAVNALDSITGESIYNAETQDAIAYYLLEIRGLSSYMNGTISREQFANSISREWAALPLVTGPKKGQSYYSGVGSNQARASVSSVLSAIDQIDIAGGLLV